MTERRQYRLLCPIARALDVLGDRWTLLILRDLHAGPARFQELQEGLGIATNLLSIRLVELTESGMIERSDGAGSVGYQLSDAGRRSDRVLWELARFGAGVERVADPREPGNLRTIALPLRILLESVADRPDLRARLIVDEAEFTISSTVEAVDVEWGRTVDPVDVVARTSYKAFLDVGEGVMSMDEFVADHLDVVTGAEKAPAFLALMGPAIMNAS
jgi:DNA-binding HxlR family transcriptional regulator